MSQYIELVHRLVLSRMEKGELNIDSIAALRNVLKEYEMHTKIIEEQLEMCKKDHADLRSEMSRLVGENQALYERLRMASESALYRGDRPALEAPEVVDNLQQQLSLALQEKDTLEAMWKSSVREADTLKEKLQEYQSGKQLVLTQNKLNDVQKDYTEAIKILENKQSTLKAENGQLNVKCQFLEEQLKQVNTQVAQVSEKTLALDNQLKETKEQEQLWKSKYLDLEAKFIELDKAYHTDKVKYAQIHEYEKVEFNLKEKLEDSLRTRDELQSALERCHERISELVRNAAADRSKVEEAVALVEGASRDRDEALSRELMATEESKKLKAELERLLDEAGQRVALEEVTLKKQFDSQMSAIRDQLRVVEQERNRKRVEVDQLQEECERLRGLATQTQLSAGADRQAERLTKQLSMAEAKCEQLCRENEALKEALDKLEERCRQNSQLRQKLKNDLHRLVQDTQYYQQELAISEQKADLLNNQLQASNLNLAQLQSNTILRRGSEGVEPRVSLTSTLELFKKINESYGQQIDKWKTEMNATTDKFEAKLKKVKKQNKVSFNKENPKAKK